MAAGAYGHLASDSGIVFKYNLCKECAAFVFSVKNGNWNDPTVRNTGSVPAAGANVYIRNNLTVNSNIKCKSLNVKNSAAFTVASGAKVEILSGNE